MSEAAVSSCAAEAIEELRFVGTCFVARGEYPRRGVDKTHTPEVDRVRYATPKTNVERLIEQVGANK